MPQCWLDMKRDDIEFFLCSEQRVLGIDAKPKHESKVGSFSFFYLNHPVHNILQTAFVAAVLGKVPQIKCRFSGQDGMVDHLKPPFTRWVL